MNERIRQLAEQAGLVRRGDWGMKRWEGPRSDSINDQDLEKFVQLIVQECARLNKHQSHELMGVIADVEEGDGFDDVCLSTVKRVAEHLAKDLLEHFEVEQ